MTAWNTDELYEKREETVFFALGYFMKSLASELPEGSAHSNDRFAAAVYVEITSLLQHERHDRIGATAQKVLTILHEYKGRKSKNFLRLHGMFLLLSFQDAQYTAGLPPLLRMCEEHNCAELWRGPTHQNPPGVKRVRDISFWRSLDSLGNFNHTHDEYIGAVYPKKSPWDFPPGAVWKLLQEVETNASSSFQQVVGALSLIDSLSSRVTAEEGYRYVRDNPHAGVLLRAVRDKPLSRIVSLGKNLRESVPDFDTVFAHLDEYGLLTYVERFKEGGVIYTQRTTYYKRPNTYVDLSSDGLNAVAKLSLRDAC